MSMRWFMPKALLLKDLECMGVKMKPAAGQAYAHLEPETGVPMLQVGDVTLYRDGRVCIWPRLSIDMRRALPALLTSAEDALMGRSNTREGWHRRRTPKTAYWRCSVFIPLPETDVLAMALRQGIDIGYEDELARDARIVTDVKGSSS